MPDIVSTDVVYTPQAQGQRTVFRTAPREKRVLAKVVFADGILTYPVGGVPLTAIAADVDLQRNIRRWELVDAGNASGIIWKVDHDNAKLRGYSSTANTPTGTNATGTVLVTAGTAGDAVTNNAGVLESTGGQDLTTEAQVFTGDAVAAADFTELAGGVATPAEQTLFLYAYGW